MNIIDDSESEIDDMLKVNYDTHLNNDVKKWIKALKSQRHTISLTSIVAVCRFSNWLSLDGEKGEK